MKDRLYYRLTETFSDIGKLIPIEENVQTHIKNTDLPHFKSIYFYNEEQKKQAEEVIEINGNSRPRGISGIIDVKTNKIVFDFDHPEDIEIARKDAIVICERLLSHGLEENNLQICFSGKKGFGIEVEFDDVWFSPKEMKNLVNDFASDLETFDAVVVNPSRIFRVPLTKHNSSDYYKTPLTFNELQFSKIDEILEIASNSYDPSCLDIWKIGKVPETFHQIKTIELEAPKTLSPVAGQEHDLDFSNMPKGFTKWKYALLQGYFPEGTRSSSLIILASTLRFFGYSETTAYYMLKSAADLQSRRFDTEKFSKEDIWNTVISQVYSQSWRGGCYAEDNFPPALQKYLLECGIPRSRQEQDTGLRNVKELFGSFKNFAENIDKNTIKLGIEAIDKNTRITTGMLFGLLGGAGSGKCLGKDTPIIMYDGSTKKVQDIQFGDLLMGDDSTPRKVLNTCYGREQLYKVNQRNGDSYIVNESHILSLKCSLQKRYDNCDPKRYPREDRKRYNKGNITDINILDYLSESKKFRQYNKGYKVPIEFDDKSVNFDPYFMGFWLGDGTFGQPNITSNDQELESYYKEFARIYNLEYRKRESDNRCETHIFTTDRSGFNNPLRDEINKFAKNNEKYIPNNYLYNSRKNRLRLLAGIIDSDGHYSNGCYEITQKSKQLIDQITYLIRSLGFRATISKVKKHCTYKGEKKEGIYYRIYMNGNNSLTEIPIRLQRKKFKPTEECIDYLATNIQIEKLEVGDYYGFEIDGNKRFLLGDFTVTHNTSIALTILNQCSLNNEEAVFYSMDMNANLIYQKLAQKHTGKCGEQIFNIFKNRNVEEIKKISYKVNQNYINTQFDFQTALTVEDMKEKVINHEESTGKKVKLVVVDYLECICGPYSDPTANGGFVANALKDLASDLDVCVLLLLQTQKASGDVSEPLRSMRKVKGSSVLEQACSIIISMWRTGFNPRQFQDDRFVTFCCVKNRMGKLFEEDCGWSGVEGDVYELDDNERQCLEELHKIKEQERKTGEL